MFGGSQTWVWKEETNGLDCLVVAKVGFKPNKELVAFVYEKIDAMILKAGLLGKNNNLFLVPGLRVTTIT